MYKYWSRFRVVFSSILVGNLLLVIFFLSSILLSFSSPNMRFTVRVLFDCFLFENYSFKLAVKVFSVLYSVLKLVLLLKKKLNAPRPFEHPPVRGSLSIPQFYLYVSFISSTIIRLLVGFSTLL